MRICLLVIPPELPFGDVAVVSVSAQLLFRPQLNAVVGELAFPPLPVLSGTIFTAVDGAFGPTPDVLAQAAIDLVFRLQALGHRVPRLMWW